MDKKSTADPRIYALVVYCFLSHQCARPPHYLDLYEYIHHLQPLYWFFFVCHTV